MIHAVTPSRSDDRPPIGLSVVAPCYNETEVLPAFVARACAAAHAVVGHDYELVLVDDGSKDHTWATICELRKSYPRIVGVKLRRNHGHQLAATAGLFVAKGARVLLIDADLQDPPELLSQMMPIMDGGANVVYGQRGKREGETWFKLTTAAAFYRVLSKLSSVSIPVDTGDFRLMDRESVDLFKAMPEQHRFIRGMISWIGGRQVPLLYDRDARLAGDTKYPLTKMIRFAVDAITSFSAVPLRFAIWAGAFAAMIAVILILYTVVQFFRHSSQVGWASLMTALSFFSAVQLMVLGVLGEYVGRMVEENKRRPLFMISEITSDGSVASVISEAIVSSVAS